LLPAPSPLGTPLIELKQVDSTNNYATGLVHAGLAGHGTAVLASHQTAGKGQRQKGWLTEPGANITLSLIIRPGQGFGAPSFAFSQAIALGAQRFFARYAGDETFVKWPNDLYWRDRKAGGILIENILAGPEWKWAIVGLGININQADFGELNGRAVSLRQITGAEWDLKSLALELCTSIEMALKQLHENPERIESDYHQVLFGLGTTVKLRKGTRLFSAEILGVTPQGALRVRHAVEEQFAVGEVVWVF
jgi:BirA family biotin operon repressor/biotin-[acetyl-CoA-carboxylase] ligase